METLYIYNLENFKYENPQHVKLYLRYAKQFELLFNQYLSIKNNEKFSVTDEFYLKWQFLNYRSNR